MNWRENWHKQLIHTWRFGSCRITIDLWATVIAWLWAFLIALLIIT